MVTTQDFLLMVKLICLTILFEIPLDRTTPFLRHVSLPYRDKLRIARAVINKLRPLILTSDISWKELETSYYKACQNILDVRLPPNIGNIFRKELRAATNTSFVLNISVYPHTTLFVDIEGPACKPVEITIIATSGIVIRDLLHLYGIPDDTDKNGARYCHGILNHTLPKHNQTEIRDKVTVLFQQLENLDTIYANGIVDIQAFFTSYLNIAIKPELLKDVFYPTWDERATLYSHQVISLAKQRRLPPPPLTTSPCHFKEVHKYYDPPIRTINTLAQLARKAAKCHCSLYDTMEIYYYITKPTLNTCSDSV